MVKTKSMLTVLKSPRKNSSCIETNLNEMNASQYSIKSTARSSNNETQKETKEQTRRKQEKKQDKKAARTLSALLLAFLITWLPYNLNVVVNSFCSNCLDKYSSWQLFGNHLFKFL